MREGKDNDFFFFLDLFFFLLFLPQSIEKEERKKKKKSEFVVDCQRRGLLEGADRQKVNRGAEGGGSLT